MNMCKTNIKSELVAFFVIFRYDVSERLSDNIFIKSKKTNSQKFVIVRKWYIIEAAEKWNITRRTIM